MKLIIQIPCFNEEKTLGRVLADLPKKIEGIDSIEVQIIDDGSTDRTLQIAKENGVQKFVILKENQGLARAFMAGIESALKQGADIIVNTDGDHQYAGSGISQLVQPIIKGNADLVIGARPIDGMDDFSWAKKRLQRLGSAVVRYLSNTKVDDATSGFRAYSRKAALSINVFSHFTYTLETLIQIGQSGMVVHNVPIEVNRSLRPSRLSPSSMNYIFRSLITMLIVSTQYRPLRTFFSFGLFCILLGLLPVAKYILLYLGTSEYVGHIQSLILGSIFILFGATSCLIGLLAEQVANNRRILDRINASIRDKEWR